MLLYYAIKVFPTSQEICIFPFIDGPVDTHASIVLRLITSSLLGAPEMAWLLFTKCLK